jgi:agmatinase
MSYFLSSEVENSLEDEALFHVIPAPLEDSVSYGKGTSLGPKAILVASQQLEVWDGESLPCDLGIHTTAAVKGRNTVEFLDNLQERVDRTLSFKKIPVVLGGEHTVSLGACRAVLERYGAHVGLVQIDAHADLRYSYENNQLSHASVIRRIHEESFWPIYQLGIRAICPEEVEYQKEQGIHCISGKEAAQGPVMDITLPDEFPPLLYLTVDVDGLDSSIMPATGTPVPGGLQWYQTLSLIESVASQRQIIGFDLVELAPEKTMGYCDYTAAELCYRIMGIIQRSRS